MKNEITLQVRAFPVLIKDERTGEHGRDLLVLSKEQLQAAQLVGQSSRELIWRLYNRKGFKVLEIGKPDKRSLCVDLTGLHQGMTTGRNAAAIDVTNEIKGFLSSYGVKVRAGRQFCAEFDAAGLTVSEYDTSGGGPAFKISAAGSRKVADV